MLANYHNCYFCIVAELLQTNLLQLIFWPMVIDNIDRFHCYSIIIPIMLINTHALVSSTNFLKAITYIPGKVSGLKN